MNLPPAHHPPRRREPEDTIHPLDLLYAGIGYLGLLYEGQLLYLKNEMEKSVNPDEELIDTLRSTYIFGVEAVSRLFSRQLPPQENLMEDSINHGAKALKQLASQGKRFIDTIEKEGLSL